MSELSFECPRCKADLAVDESAVGATSTCPQCGDLVIVPKQSHPIAVQTPDKSITIRLGFAAKQGRTLQKPSRKLVYALVGSWVVITLLSIPIGMGIGHSQGQSNGYQNGETMGREAGFQAGKTLALQQGVYSADVVQKIQEIAFSDGRNAAFATFQQINISSGTSAQEVRQYLGTPTSITLYTPQEYATINVQWPCWHYGDVKIYLNGNYDISSVTHWDGDLQKLLNERLHR